jgi:hypothetical protein
LKSIPSSVEAESSDALSAAAGEASFEGSSFKQLVYIFGLNQTFVYPAMKAYDYL